MRIRERIGMFRELSIFSTKTVHNSIPPKYAYLAIVKSGKKVANRSNKVNSIVLAGTSSNIAMNVRT